MWFQLFEEDVRRNFEDNIRHEEDGQGGVVFNSLQLEIFHQAINGGIGNVRPVQEGQQIQYAQNRNNAQVDFGDEPALRYTSR
jgi:hypothetical protein